jgi:hypothetical protein
VGKAKARRLDRLPEMAAELVSRQPAVIVTRCTLNVPERHWRLGE